MESIKSTIDQPIQRELEAVDLHHATKRALEWIVPGAFLTHVDLRFGGNDIFPDILGWLLLFLTCCRLAKLMMPVTFPCMLAIGMCLFPLIVSSLPVVHGLHVEYVRINNLIFGCYESLADFFFWGIILSWMGRVAGRLGDNHLKRSVTNFLLLNLVILLTACFLFLFKNHFYFPAGVAVVIILSLILVIWIDTIRTRFGAAVLSEQNFEKLINALQESEPINSSTEDNKL